LKLGDAKIQTRLAETTDCMQKMQSSGDLKEEHRDEWTPLVMRAIQICSWERPTPWLFFVGR